MSQSSIVTQIDPKLHRVICAGCSFRTEFGNLDELAAALLVTRRIYNDAKLAEVACPVCQSKSLKLQLKSVAVRADQSRPSEEPKSVKPQASILDPVRDDVLALENDASISDNEKVARIRNTACVTCAMVAVQPIPFADIFILTPIQGFFASRIAAIRGVPLSEQDAQEWAKRVVGLMGLGFLAQQIAIGIWKTVTFGAGGLLTIPLVYALTYGVMQTADAYFQNQARGVKLSDEQIRDLIRSATKEGSEEAKRRPSA